MSQVLQEDSAEIVQQLLRAAAENGPSRPPDEEVVEYDWQVPRRFVPAELRKLDNFLAAAAEKASEGLSNVLGGQVKLVAAPLKQQYLAQLRSGLAGSKDYTVALALKGGRPCGFMVLPAATALGWVERLLGGSTQADSADRDLSAVERGLLLDVVKTLTDGFSAASGHVGGPPLEHTDRLTRGPADLLTGEDWEDYCQFSLAADGSEDGTQVSVLMPGAVAEGVASRQGAAKAARGEEELRRDLVRHLEAVKLTAEVRLGQAEVAMRDILSLAPGDVLVTETKADEPIQLLVQGKVLLTGFPVRSLGRYALAVPAAGPGGDTPAQPGEPAG